MHVQTCTITHLYCISTICLNINHIHIFSLKALACLQIYTTTDKGQISCPLKTSTVLMFLSLCNALSCSSVCLFNCLSLLVQYGYQLPSVSEDEVIYCSVYFKPIGEKLFTYPLVKVLVNRHFPDNKILLSVIYSTAFALSTILSKTPIYDLFVLVLHSQHHTFNCIINLKAFLLEK